MRGQRHGQAAWCGKPASGTLRPMTTTSTAWGVLGVCACAMGLLSCSSNSTPDAMTQPSLATTTGGHAANEDVTDRARAALTEVGAQRLVMEPGYEGEVNTAFEGVWRGYPVIAYVVPTSALPPSSELTVVAHRRIKGQAVDVVKGEDSTVRMLRFLLGPDTWLVASRDSRTVSVALVGALMA
jgi:hypothetical protein